MLISFSSYGDTLGWDGVGWNRLVSSNRDQEGLTGLLQRGKTGSSMLSAQVIFFVIIH